jgi:hypothetical protein
MSPTTVSLELFRFRIFSIAFPNGSSESLDFDCFIPALPKAKHESFCMECSFFALPNEALAASFPPLCPIFFLGNFFPWARPQESLRCFFVYLLGRFFNVERLFLRRFVFSFFWSALSWS